jgi:hypothetical protein
MEENLCGVASRPAKIKLFTAYDSRVPQASEVQTEFTIVISTKLFTEYLGNTINSLRFLDCINWRVNLLKLTASK